jgi:farnesyl-diphosphate farnesyltransferase
VPADLASGRCYLPARELAGLGLRPADLLDPGGARRAMPVYHRLLARARDHYEVAWRYTLAIPRPEWRMRLACAWPLLIGRETLAALAAHPAPLAAPRPVKISRARVRAIVAGSLARIWSNRLLAREAARR